MTAQWKTLVDHVMSIPQGVYEHWTSSIGWDNHTKYGVEYGEDGVSWCVIFDWDMYHDAGLAAIVPKTDNVTSFSTWAKNHGQWSEYPSIGAWVNFGNGAHTEIVVGFDASYVYTVGGNSVKTGATDNGQGNGVWAHAHLRTDAYVTGYFAPRYPDGQCPPTADPTDYRAAPPQTSWRWSAPVAPPVTPPVVKPPSKPPVITPTTRIPAYPVGIAPGHNKPAARTLQMLLKKTGWMADSVPYSDNYGPLTQAGVAGFNAKHGMNNKGLTRDPAIGPKGWALLCKLALG